MRAAVAILLVGCAGEAPLLGIAPSDVPPADTTVSDEPRILHSHFRTTATNASVRTASCSLEPSIEIQGRPIRVALRAFGSPCHDAPAESVAMTVEEREGEIVLEMEVPETLTGSDVDHFRDGFREIGRELTRRVRALEASSRWLHTEQPTRRADPRTKSQKVMLTSGQLWAITLATGAVGGTIMGGGVASGNLGVELTGAAALLFITGPLFLGALTTTIVAGGLYAAEP